MLRININAEETAKNLADLTGFLESAKKTAGKCSDLYLLLGMVGEAGEVIDVLKKIVRDTSNGLDLIESLAARRDKIVDELGDFMWYCTIYHENLIENNFIPAGFPSLNLDSAIESALNLVMQSTELATLATHSAPVKTEATLDASLCAVYDICLALQISFHEILEKNIEKLSARYADGFKLGVK